MKHFYFTLILLGSLILYQTGYSKNISSFDQGRILYQNGKYEVALVFFERAFKENPLNWQLYFYQGNIYNHKQMFKMSIQAYKRGLELTSENNKIPFLFNLARSYQAANKYKEALKIYNDLEKVSLYPSIHLYKGMIYYKLRKKDQVIKSWETYLVKAPSNPQYQSVRKAIDFLKDKNFKWSPSEKENVKVVYVGVGAINGIGIQKENVAKSAREEDKKIVEGEEKSAENNNISEKDTKESEDKLVKELREKEEEETNKEIDKSVLDVNIDSEDIEVQDQGKKEGKEYDEIER